MNAEHELQPLSEPAEAAQAAPRKVPLTHRTAAKVTSFLLCLVMILVTAAGAVSILLAFNYDLYTTSETQFRRDLYLSAVYSDARQIADLLLEGDEGYAPAFCASRNFSSVTAEAEGLSWSWDSEKLASDITFSVTVRGVSLTITIAKYLSVDDQYALLDKLVTAAYALRWWLFPLTALALAAVAALFVFLMCASGRRPDGSVTPGWGTGFPLDLLTLFAALSMLMLFVAAQDLSWESDLLAGGFLALTWPPVLLGWCMSFALRKKLGGWWRNTVIWKLGSALHRALRSFSFAPVAVIALLVFTALEFIFQLVFWYEPDVLLMIWILSRVFLLLLLSCEILRLSRLLQAGKAMAEGDLDRKIDLDGLHGHLLTHAEHLNRIGEGMNTAVEERLRSEHTKAELFTNISHDLKTPLTSLINYSDLIGQTPCGDPAITEYAQALHRQSQKLKRLIDDLVELSKSTTGSVTLDLAPCETGVFLHQMAGEYEQRMKDCGLEPVVRVPDRSLVIRADGLRLWRIMDNLMGNVCKYALSGTRVYLSLEERENNAVFIFRNTSRDVLDRSAQELMERFVRGDASRSAEGSGLGLAIAQSLTQLMGGTFRLDVDGDLFKVTLSFPLSE